MKPGGVVYIMATMAGLLTLEQYYSDLIAWKKEEMHGGTEPPE
jgi:hypothetical protein